MSSQSAYLAYKRDTRYLLYWIIRVSNSIIRSLSTSAIGEKWEINTTGETTVAGLVSMVKLIAKHVSKVPPAIHKLFHSVIKARYSMYAEFQRLVARKPDPELQKSNDSHKVFIDALDEAFEILGGKAWLSQQLNQNDKGTGIAEDVEDIEEAIFTNRFSGLSLGPDEEPDDEEDEIQDEGHEGPSRTSQSRKRKWREGKQKKPKLK